jgi:glycosyltransferase involved in cell wall biosynthesis
MLWPDRRNALRAGLDAARLAWWARSNRVDVIHCNEHDLYPFAVLLARLARLPIVCHVRCKLDVGFADWSFGKREPDALIWCTHQMQAEYGRLAERTTRSARQHVIPLGVDLKTSDNLASERDKLRGEWGVGPCEVVVGMACALRPGKRVADFLSLAEWFQNRTDTRFVLAGGHVPGDEAHFEELRPLIEAAVTRGTVRWLGHVEPIEPFLRAIDVFVSTSEHESFGMSVCEAMACGRSVAAYAACSVREVVGPAALIVETGDLPGLTAAVERLILDARLRQSLGARARQRVGEHFNPQDGVEQLMGIYRSVARRRVSRSVS